MENNDTLSNKAAEETIKKHFPDASRKAIKVWSQCLHEFALSQHSSLKEEIFQLKCAVSNRENLNAEYHKHEIEFVKIIADLEAKLSQHREKEGEAVEFAEWITLNEKYYCAEDRDEKNYWWESHTNKKITACELYQLFLQSKQP